MWRRRRYYRRKVRVGLRKRRYFRRAGVVSKFSSPAAMNKLSALKSVNAGSSYDTLVTNFVEINRAVKTLNKAWRYKFKNPMTVANCVTWMNERANYQNKEKSEMRAKNKQNALKRKIFKYACGAEQGSKILADISTGDDMYYMTLSAMAKCRSKGMMLQLITAAERNNNFTLDGLGRALSTVATALFDAYIAVVPMTVPTNAAMEVVMS